jgi:hypothetical protein
MLETIVDLLDGLSLIAVIVLTVFSVVGSIVAAFRAVSPGTSISTSRQRKLIDDVSERSVGLLDPKPQMRSAGNTLKQNGPRERPISPQQAEQA